MATRTVLVDDLDGNEAFRTVRFAFDGRNFEIDLSREHYDSFKHGLGPWMDAAREVSKYSAKPTGSPKRTSKQSKAIREWGIAQGMSVPTRGMVPQNIVVAYELAHQKSQAAPTAPAPTPPAHAQVAA